jgi:hypothetical protein
MKKKSSSFFLAEKEMSSNTLSLVPVFSPLQISGCSLWYDASDPANLSRTGTTVNSWTSKGINSTVVSQSTSNPTYVSNAYNSLPTVRFSFGNTLALSNASVSNAVVQTNSNYGIFLVHNPNANNNVPLAFITATAPRLAITTPESSNVQFDGVGARLQYSYASQATYLNGNIRMESFISLSSTGYYRRDGSQFATGSLGSGTYSNTQVLFVGGAHPIFNNYYYGGDICEVVWYNQALTTAQTELVEGYLAWKWGTVTYLPSNHPYKNTQVFNVSVFPAPIRNITATPLAPSFAPFSFFNPASVSTCRLWLDAADPSTLSLSGSNVTQWRDKSGNGFNATASGNPVYNSALNRIQMNGSTSYLSNTSTYSLTLASRTTFVIMSENTRTINAGVIVQVPNPQSGTDYIAVTGCTFETANGMTSGGGYVGGTPGYTNTIGNSTLLPLAIYAETMNGRTNILYLNGTAGNTVTANYDPGTSSGYVVGARWISGAVSGAYLNGNINEIISYSNVLTTAQRQQIEGYLAWKWGLQASLPANHPYKNVPPGLSVPSVPPRLTMSSRSFSPLSFSGLQLWLDAADTATVILSGGNVSQWSDKSGNNNNATVSTGNITYSANGIVFSGGQMLQTPLSVVNNTQTAFIIMSYTGAGGSSRTLLGVKATTYNNGYFQYISATNVQTLDRFGGTFIASGATLTPNVRFMHGAIINGGSTSFLYLNGAQSGTAGSTATVSGTADTVSIGAYQDGASPSAALIGTMNEILLYYAILTTAQRQSIEGYLAWKWGLQGSLPTNHPYKRFPPAPN